MTIEYHLDDTVFWSTRSGHAAQLVDATAGEWRVTWCPDQPLTREAAHAALEFAELIWTTDIAPTHKQAMGDIVWRAVGLGLDPEQAQELAGQNPPYPVPHGYTDDDMPELLSRVQAHFAAR